MNNLAHEQIQATLSIASAKRSWPQRSWKLLRLSGSLCYSTILSILSPISAIGALALLNHFLLQH